MAKQKEEVRMRPTVDKLKDLVDEFESKMEDFDGRSRGWGKRGGEGRKVLQAIAVICKEARKQIQEIKNAAK